MLAIFVPVLDILFGVPVGNRNFLIPFCHRDKIQTTIFFKCKRGKYEFRVKRRWFTEKKRFCIWLTYLPPSQLSADDIISAYRCRWQIKLLFKALKSHIN